MADQWGEHSSKRRHHGYLADLSEPRGLTIPELAKPRHPGHQEEPLYLAHSHKLTAFRRKITQVCRPSPPLGGCSFLRAKGSPVNVDHNSTQEMIDWNSFAGDEGLMLESCSAGTFPLLGWHISCARGLLWVLRGQGGGVLNEGSFYANPASPHRSGYSFASLIPIEFFFPPKHFNSDSYISSNVLL